MNVLLLNASPRRDKSNTLRVADVFLAGMARSAQAQVRRVDIYAQEIAPCTGCFGCWTRTPGRCVLADDMADILAAYITADVVVWSVPLYYYGMPSQGKAVMDRLLPLSEPQIVTLPDGRNGHPQRYDLRAQKCVLISTCGFYETVKNYAPLTAQFDMVYGDYTRILCPEGELLRVPQLASRAQAYLAKVRQAGEVYGRDGALDASAQAALAAPMVPPEAFVRMANASWEIADDKRPQRDPVDRFMQQMAATFNPAGAQGVEAVLEMVFTDAGKTFQLHIHDGACTLHAGAPAPCTTRITTTLENWKKVSSGQVSGPEGMMRKLYRTTGDFSFMLRMNDIFGGAPPETPAARPAKKRSMLLFLAPWIVLWSIAPLHAQAAGMGAMLAAALIAALAPRFFDVAPWEYANLPILGALAALAVFTPIAQELFVLLTYGVSAVMWLASAWMRVPLTAHYSCKGYGGTRAFANPLFIRTNRILTVVWGVYYALMAGAAYLVMRTPLAPYAGLLSMIAPLALGAFTAWFARWYPAYVARG
nr:flavodoxin family protein [Maliibacterium massiliense]